jgi:hypothetical protein
MCVTLKMFGGTVCDSRDTKYALDRKYFRLICHLTQTVGLFGHLWVNCAVFFKNLNTVYLRHRWVGWKLGCVTSWTLITMWLQARSHQWHKGTIGDLDGAVKRFQLSPSEARSWYIRRLASARRRRPLIFLDKFYRYFGFFFADESKYNLSFKLSQLLISRFSCI